MNPAIPIRVIQALGQSYLRSASRSLTPERSYGVYSLRQDLLGKMTLSRAEEELKATELLSRGPLRKNVAKREFVETLFEYLRDFPIAIFAIVMERPTERPYRGPEVLQRQYWWLLERVNRFVATDHPGHMAIPIFDRTADTNMLREYLTQRSQAL
jgi:hypothetical protein